MIAEMTDDDWLGLGIIAVITMFIFCLAIMFRKELVYKFCPSEQSIEDLERRDELRLRRDERRMDRREREWELQERKNELFEKQMKAIQKI